MVIVRCLAAALAWAGWGEVLEDESVGHYLFCGGGKELSCFFYVWQLCEVVV